MNIFLYFEVTHYFYTRRHQNPPGRHSSVSQLQSYMKVAWESILLCCCLLYQKALEPHYAAVMTLVLKKWLKAEVANWLQPLLCLMIHILYILFHPSFTGVKVQYSNPPEEWKHIIYPEVSKIKEKQILKRWIIAKSGSLIAINLAFLSCLSHFYFTYQYLICVCKSIYTVKIKLEIETVHLLSPPSFLNSQECFRLINLSINYLYRESQNTISFELLH